MLRGETTLFTPMDIVDTSEGEVSQMLSTPNWHMMVWW